MVTASPALSHDDLVSRAILWLDDPSADITELVGTKAAHLSRLIQADFHVPSGFVVTTAAYEHAIQVAGIRDELHRLAKLPAPTDETNLRARVDQLAATVAGLAVTPELALAIVDASQCLDPVGTAVAVRSSAPSGHANGSHPTFTWVSGRDGLLEAVRACWVALRPHQDPTTAVVVQRMVDADRAGIAFSADPRTGDPDAVVVEATFGLGEAARAGEVEPDTYVLGAANLEIRSVQVGHKSIMCKRGADGHTVTEALPEYQASAWTLTDDEAAQVARLALDVADFYGRPMNIEWAFDGDDLWLLQAQPLVLTGAVAVAPL